MGVLTNAQPSCPRLRYTAFLPHKVVAENPSTTSMFTILEEIIEQVMTNTKSVALEEGTRTS